MTEEQLQVQCFQWHWNSYPNERQMLWHNNNNSSSVVEGNRNKARGVVKGVLDFSLITRSGMVYIEMKLPGEKLTPEQQTFWDKAVFRGCHCVICYSFEEFKKFINYIYGN